MAEKTLGDVVVAIERDRQSRHADRAMSDAIKTELKSVTSGIHALLDYFKLKDSQEALANKETEKEKTPERDRLGEFMGMITAGFATAKNPGLFGLAALIPFAISFESFLNGANETVKKLDRQMQGYLASAAVGIQGILNFGTKFANMLGRQLKNIGAMIATLSKPFQAFVNGIRSIFRPLGMMFGMATSFLDDVLKVFVGLPLRSIGGVLKTISRFSGFLTAAVIVFDGLMNAVTKTWDKNKSFWANIFSLDFLGAFLMGMWDSVVTTITGIFEILVGNIPALFGKIVEGVKWLTGKLGFEFQFLDSVIEAVNKFSAVWKGFIEEKIIPFFEQVLDPRKIFENVTWVGEKLAQGIGSMISFFGNVKDDLLDKMGQGLNKIKSGLNKVTDDVTDFLDNLASGVTQRVGNLLNRLNPFKKNDRKDEEREAQRRREEQEAERIVKERERRARDTNARQRNRDERIQRSSVQSAQIDTDKLATAIDRLNQTIRDSKSAPIVVAAPSSTQTTVNNSSRTFVSAPMSPANRFDPSMAY